MCFIESTVFGSCAPLIVPRSADIVRAKHLAMRCGVLSITEVMGPINISGLCTFGRPFFVQKPWQALFHAARWTIFFLFLFFNSSISCCAKSASIFLQAPSSFRKCSIFLMFSCMFFTTTLLSIIRSTRLVSFSSASWYLLASHLPPLWPGFDNTQSHPAWNLSPCPREGHRQWFQAMLCALSFTPCYSNNFLLIFLWAQLPF